MPYAVNVVYYQIRFTSKKQSRAENTVLVVMILYIHVNR